ncbi:hypothetical protein AB9N12_08460 [Bacteroides sp. AN502(2024)]|uniref:hypothetical protein n=1 Tax=Bacteroides sp. AN502(2024) TaxID=3160599 RepID=UPI00351948A2
MKKLFAYLTCATLLLGTVAAISSCKDDDDDWKGCQCIAEYSDGEERENITADDARKEGANSCKDLERIISEWDDELIDVTCTNL